MQTIGNHQTSQEAAAASGVREPEESPLGSAGPCVGSGNERRSARMAEWERQERPPGVEGTRCRSSSAGAGKSYEGVRERRRERPVPGRLAAS